MSISVEEIVTGRKTFFITPDRSLLPEGFLEDYFALGYECYFIDNDKKLDIRTKLDIIINTFKDVILFFNIDFQIPGVDWDEIIQYLINRYDKQTSIGVLYVKRQSKEEIHRLEKKYLYEMGLNCGCIQLEYQKKQNFVIIEKILKANQAQGRRKNIRALCTSTCTFQIDIDGKSYNGTLQDISLSHFSFVLPENAMPVQLYEKLSEFHFNVRGFLFKSDAVLIMQRTVNKECLYVFSYTSSTGANGLDERINLLLIPIIYQILSTNCKTILDQLFIEASNRIKVEEPTEDSFDEEIL